MVGEEMRFVVKTVVIRARCHLDNDHRFDCTPIDCVYLGAAIIGRYSFDCTCDSSLVLSVEDRV